MCHDPKHGFIDARFAEDGIDQTIFVHGAFSVGDDGISLGGVMPRQLPMHNFLRSLDSTMVFIKVGSFTTVVQQL